METPAALLWVRLAVPLAPAIWAGLLALGEEAAVGEALHTLGDAPPATVTGRVPLHRALYLARLALLVLGAVAAAYRSEERRVGKEGRSRWSRVHHRPRDEQTRHQPVRQPHATAATQ